MSPLTTDTVLSVLFGSIILLAGRNFFWLFIGLLGFLVGAQLADSWLTSQPAWLTLVIAIGAGLIGAALAILFERVAFSVAGFYAGAFLVMALASDSGMAVVHPAWIIAAGLVGAILAAIVMDWAIIALSALAGAAAVVSAVALAPGIKALLFVILAAIGVVVQRATLTHRKRILKN